MNKFIKETIPFGFIVWLLISIMSLSSLSYFAAETEIKSMWMKFMNSKFKKKKKKKFIAIFSCFQMRYVYLVAELQKPLSTLRQFMFIRKTWLNYKIIFLI